MIWNFVHSYNSSMIRSNYNPLSKPNNTTRKKVSFDQMVRVILIPHLNEYKYFGLDLWYNENDFLRFRRQSYSF
jgi:hypothetical protein